MRITFLHPQLDFTDGTARLIATVRAALAAGHEVSVVSDKGSRTTAMLRTGAQCFVGELPTDPLLGVFAMGRARHQISELHPDLLHVTDGRLAPLAAKVSAALEIPYILELANVPEDRLRLDLNWLRATLVPCPTFIEKAVNVGQAPRASLKVIEHGPCLDRDWVPRPSIDDQRPVILKIGTLDRDHGVDVLIDAARLLDSAQRAVNVLVLGAGPEEQALRRQVRELHLSEVVTISCPVLPDLATAFAQTDLHVSCVRSGNPGWSAAQAHGLGIPSIFSAISSTFGWVDDRQSGLLVERNDPEKLAEAISVLLENRTAATQMGVRAREKSLEIGRYQAFQQELGELHTCALV
ncbi:MAG: glycosyltransferase involved in cell wall biosynthesis [Candidatus Paceibacteria bacterium]|jgi:glycosyltransferase involved in cell wall biosynthesis